MLTAAFPISLPSWFQESIKSYNHTNQNYMEDVRLHLAQHIFCEWNLASSFPELFSLPLGHGPIYNLLELIGAFCLHIPFTYLAGPGRTVGLPHLFKWADRLLFPLNSMCDITEAKSIFGLESFMAFQWFSRLLKELCWYKEAFNRQLSLNSTSPASQTSDPWDNLTLCVEMAFSFFLQCNQSWFPL